MQVTGSPRNASRWPNTTQLPYRSRTNSRTDLPCHIKPASIPLPGVPVGPAHQGQPPHHVVAHDPGSSRSAAHPRCILDAGNHPQCAATIGTRLKVDGEHPLEALHPGHGGFGLIAVHPPPYCARHNLSTMPEVGRKHTMKTGLFNSLQCYSAALDESHWVRQPCRRHRSNIRPSTSRKLSNQFRWPLNSTVTKPN